MISGELDKVTQNTKSDTITKGHADEKTYLTAMAGMYHWMITRLPVVISVIAGIIAFIGYIVELAKYFYISPFVVAFALTTKKTHKIVEFMITIVVAFKIEKLLKTKFYLDNKRLKPLHHLDI